MRVFKNAWFERFAKKQHISDQALLDTIANADKGLIDADLGGGVIKQRIARQGQGKSGGFRTIILYRTADKAFFVYGFAKSERDNIDGNEEAQFRKAARYVLALSDAQLSDLIALGHFVEINRNGD